MPGVCSGSTPGSGEGIKSGGSMIRPGRPEAGRSLGGDFSRDSSGVDAPSCDVVLPAMFVLRNGIDCSGEPVGEC